LSKDPPAPDAAALAGSKVVSSAVAAGVGSKVLPIDPDLPGAGQFPCVYCDRYFIDEETRAKHVTTKPHKRRVKLISEVPLDQEIEKLLFPIQNK
jgi:hypothetical protein